MISLEMLTKSAQSEGAVNKAEGGLLKCFSSSWNQWRAFRENTIIFIFKQVVVKDPIGTLSYKHMWHPMCISTDMLEVQNMGTLLDINGYILLILAPAEYASCKTWVKLRKKLTWKNMEGCSKHGVISIILPCSLGPSCELQSVRVCVLIRILFNTLFSSSHSHHIF